MIIFLMLAVPLAGMVISTLCARRSEDWRDRVYFAETLAVFILALTAFVRCLRGQTATASLPGVCAMGLSFRLDGFRGLYALIASFMWLMTGILSKEYFAHYTNRTRYYLFNQITLMATLGLFLSDDLYTTFVFFEIMSLASYPWVAHDENEGAMSAARTYLIIAVFGGMVTLMGLFMAWHALGSLSFEAFEAARGRADMAVPAALILVGFGAKAGLFPLYIWLPQAHPVAPAPASALLSGVLTKTGVFGVLVISFRLMLGVRAFGNVMLALGLITMLLGAILALLSSNLKRVLACSSMSQIGYITVGVAMAVLLGHEGHVPASGAIMHMVNHSLLKLTLFMAAGVIYMNLHKLELNDIRGFGRGKPLLHAVFLLGALGLAGVPGFNGYVGKTLIHEGILEYAHELHGFTIYNVCEWVFLFAAGITTAYMLKLYIALFWQRHPGRQAEFDEKNGRYMNRRSAFALCAAAVWIPLLGMAPALLERCAQMSEGFTGIEGVSGVAYLSIGNLKGGAVSLLIGTLVYLFVVRRWLIRPKEGYISVGPSINWRDSWPVRTFGKATAAVCSVFDHAVENPILMKHAPRAAQTVFGGLEHAVENPLIMEKVPKLAAVVSEGADHVIENRFILESVPKAVYSVFGLLNGWADGAARLMKKALFHENASGKRSQKQTIDADFTSAEDSGGCDKGAPSGRMARIVPFALQLFSGGLLFALFYLLVLK